jgi:protein-export membrane protein SecD
MPRKSVIFFAIILIVFILSLLVVFPVDKGILGGKSLRLGLDLVGGVDLVYEAQFSDNATAADKAAAMDRALLTVTRRIDTYGVTEPIIQKLGEDRISVQLPGFTDINAAKKLVEQTGFLEFREVELNQSGTPVYLSDYLAGSVNDFFDKSETGNRIFAIEEQGANYGKPVAFLVKEGGNLKFTDASGNPISKETLAEGTTNLLSWMPARGSNGLQLTGAYLSEATPTISSQVGSNEPEVSIEWNSEGAIIFDQIAKRLYNSGAYGTPQRALGIFLDNALISAPQILQPAYEGKGVITGNFTIAEAENLANLLKSGALPVQLKKPPLFQEQVSATLGANFVNYSWKAGLIGLALIMLFMVVYYKVPGVLASLSLLFYGALILAIFKLWAWPSLTLTLAGLGGFVASLGMAVDANILIFERMKEEFRAGRTLGAAIDAGFNRAWSAIRDSNITTFIACIILIIIGSNIVAGEQVKWFGVTLFVGVAVSMFTAISVTRTLLRLFVGSRLSNRTSIFTADRRRK